MNPKRFTSEGFSLIELLAVMSIIAIIAAATLPAITGVMKGSTISQAGVVVADTLKQAAESSLAQHAVVEVRFYSYADSSVAGGNAYQAIQLFKVSDDETTYTPLGPIVYLPKPAIMISDPTYSTLLDPGTTTTLNPGVNTPPALPILGTNYTYLRFAYHPNGSTDLPSTVSNGVQTLYFITVAPPKPSPPADFSTIAVDPKSGKVTLYRP